MRRGEVWWAFVDERCPVVVLSGEGASEISAMRIVTPATAEEKRGFVVMSGEEATDPQRVRKLIDSASNSASAGVRVGAIGVEVEIGLDEGLPERGVVRVALPHDGHVFCTWLVTVTPDHLLERAGELGSTKLDQLRNALRLAGIERASGLPDAPA